MRHVILPEALKNMIPSLVTQFIVLFKDTSLASIIGFMDLTKAAQVVNNREVRPFALYLFIAVVYWILHLFNVPLPAARRGASYASVNDVTIRRH